MFAFGGLASAWATAFHTVTVDGTNDFATDEDVPGTAGLSGGTTWYFTWDATNVYIGVNQTDVGANNANKSVQLYLDRDPQQNPVSGNGTSTGMLYGSSQQPTLPFNADFHFRWRTDDSSTSLFNWNGSAWVSVGTLGVDYQISHVGTFLEIRLSRAILSNPAAIYAVGGFVNQTTGSQFTYSMVPSTGNANGNDPNYASWYGYVLGDALNPDHASNLNCNPTIAVANTASSGAGSLRQAITNACNGGLITFQPALASSTIAITPGLSISSKVLTIDGAAAPNLRIDGGGAVRIFSVTGTTTRFNLYNLTLQNGNPGGASNGGALQNDSATTTISNTRILSSTAQFGGGLRNQTAGVLNIFASQISGNTAQNGGGISTNNGYTTITNSTFDNNTANGATNGFGGGVHDTNGAATTVRYTTIVNSTIANNNARHGGGVYSDSHGRISINHSTIAGNTAINQGGGVKNRFEGTIAQTMYITNTIVADNSSPLGPDLRSTSAAPIYSGGYNLFESENDASFTGTIATNVSGVDPLLGPLQNNGGPTPTKLTSGASPAINAGDPAFVPPPSTDQRGPGFPRVLSGRLDIGAIELADQTQASSPFVVNSTADPGDGTCTVFNCTLREAITAANTAAGPDTVTFAIAGSGVRTISPASALPTITQPITIDGTTQGGASCPSAPLIEITGSGAGASANGLDITAGGSTIRGLIINRFAQNGMRLATNGGNTIRCNFIGADQFGGSDAGNTLAGIRIDGSGGNTIGGTTAAARNLIAGNNTDGVSIQNTGATGNVIQGNYIGTNVNGVSGIGNSAAGIFIFSQGGNTIGGSAAGAGNLLSSNQNGINIGGSLSVGNTIQGNTIGLNAAGTAALGNTSNGIVIDGARNTQIGGTAAGARNLISANGQQGINLFTASGSGNIIQGNYIGTDATGSVDLGNFQNGVRIFRVSTTTVGGSAPGAGNLISGNNQNGVLVSEVEASGNVIQGNLIGTKADGTTALANSVDGVQIAANGPNTTTVGGTAPGAGNTIAFNTSRGVRVTTGVGHRISGNAIFGNGALGIDLNADGVTANDTGDGDSGPNNLQNYPAVTVATNGTASTGVAGTFNGAANAAFSLEFFSQATCDSSGFGEGQLYRGNTSVTTDGSGNASFTASLAGSTALGQKITATATDAAGNTSEFSQCRDVTSAPTLAIGDATVSEGNAGFTAAVFTATLSGPSALPVTVEYATADGTATAPADYTALTTATLTFLPGQTAKAITVNVVGDLIDENNETYVVNLANAVNATLADAQGAGTIIDDDNAPTITISDDTANEGNVGAAPTAFTVSLSNPSSFPVTVQYATSPGTATAGADYISVPPTTLTFAPGVTSQDITVNIVGDVIDEPNETYSVDLSNPTNATIQDGRGDGTIIDDDNAPTISIAGNSVAEGSGGSTALVFTVSLSAPSGSQITVNYATSDGSATAPADYAAIANATLTFAPGQTSQPITVTVVADLLDEPDETLQVTLSNPSNATIATGQATGTIIDDDNAPTISIAGGSVIEGNAGTRTLAFTATLSAPSGSQITVEYATADGTATAGSDYTAIPTTMLTFAPGTTAQSFTVTVQGDLFVEADETVLANLSNPSNATIAAAQATGTIINDDTPPSMSVAGGSVIEGNSGTTALTFTVTLSAASPVEVSVTYATADGTATAGSDYAAIPPTTLTFAPGVTAQSFAVTVQGDLFVEADETVLVNLSNPTNATIATAQATGTIINDDTPPSLSINDATVSEGDSGTTTLAFTVTLSAASPVAVSVDYATADGTATAPADYTAIPTATLTIVPGATSGTVNVAINGDTIDESNETFVVRLGNAANATISRSQGQATIVDDDETVVTTNKIYLSLLVMAPASEPDLVVTSIAASSGGVTVVIKNQGSGAVTEPFWVDAYVNPATAPTAVNQTWDQVGTEGLVWGVRGASLPLAPGASLTLAISDTSYFPEYSHLDGPIAAGSRIYAQADSANNDTAYGAVLEADEAPGGTYNNILGPIVSTALAAVDQSPARAPSGTQPADLGGLPRR